MADLSYVRRNLDEVRRRLEQAAARAGRAVPVLCAVTKSGTDEEVLALAALGVGDMGENRPQELVRRSALLKAAGYSPRMHEIGNLQKNKVRSVLGVAALIHSVGSLPLAQEISRRAVQEGRVVPILLEINSGEEAGKGGVLPADALSVFEKIRQLPGLSLEGLMTMGPALSDPEQMRPYFRRTREIAETASARFGFSGSTPVLSMGMSDSFEVATEEGATIVRVGRRLFEKHCMVV